MNRPNLMIKVVATPEGVRAVEALIAEGININITLMFSLDHYEAVANAYIRGPAAMPRAVPGRLGGIVLRQPGRHEDRSGARRDWYCQMPSP